MAFANQLKIETKADRHAIVFIYDDRRAALLRKDALAERLKKAPMKLHDDHMIGAYYRNINTGFHAVTISLDGVGEKGKMKEIPLQYSR